jgi:hypothetical protein
MFSRFRYRFDTNIRFFFADKHFTHTFRQCTVSEYNKCHANQLRSPIHCQIDDRIHAATTRPQPLTGEISAKFMLRPVLDLQYGKHCILHRVFAFYFQPNACAYAQTGVRRGPK